jgi:hypothetical protein
MAGTLIEEHQSHHIRTGGGGHLTVGDARETTDFDLRCHLRLPVFGLRSLVIRQPGFQFSA